MDVKIALLTSYEMLYAQVMTHRIHDKIKAALDSRPGLTQKGLAKRMGLNPAAVNRMLYGRRNIMATEIPIIEDYLGVKLPLSHNDKSRGVAEAGQESISAPENSVPLVPVYGCGKKQNISDEKIIDWVQRHPAQFGIRDAFALYVFDDTMAPRYFRGELVYVHPGRPAEAGRDVVLETVAGETLLLRLLRQTDGKIRVAQYNPAGERDVAKKDIKVIYPVVGRG